jgi:hypothetical protein
MSWKRGVAAVAAVLALGGCDAVAGQAEPQLGAQAAPRHPADRNGDAVLSALRKLDACALLDHAQPIALAPHACAFVLDQKSMDEVDVTLGLDSPFSRRFGMIPLTVGGARAYVDDLSRSGDPRCQIDIPVSFEFAVNLVAKPGYHSAGSACDQAKAAAATVAAKLGNPDTVTVPSSRPLADWDACSVLTKALGRLDPKAKLRQDPTASPFDTCGIQTDNASPAPTVRVSYDKDPLSGLNRTPRPVGDKTADVSVIGAACDVSWNAGPSGSTPSHTAVVVDVVDKGCDAATALAVKVQQVLAGPAPSSDRPQRPLIYGADDPDTDAVGACVDFSQHDGSCAPYQPFTLPSFQEWFPVTDSQPSIGCALATDAVRQVYGDTFTPVLWGEHCVFVEPTHALNIVIDVSAKYVPGDYGARPDLYANRKTVAISGKQANTFTDLITSARPGHPNYDEYDVYVSPFDDISRPGMIAGEIQARPPRGSGLDTPPDVSRLHDLDQVMSKIIARYGP